MKKGLILVIVLLALAGYSASHKQDPTHNQQQPTHPPAESALPAQQVKPKQETSKRQKTVDWLNMLLTWPEGVGAIAVILTLGAIVWQSDETRKAAVGTEAAVVEAKASRALAQRTAKRQLRAYICMDTADVRFVAGQPHATVNFKNCGETPAYEVRGWIGIEVMKYPPELPSSPPLRTLMPKQTIGPQGGLQYAGQRRSSVLSRDEIEKIEVGFLTFFVFGRIDYKDTFGKEWYTVYRLMAGGPEGVRAMVAKDGSPIWALTPDVEGNEAT
jgi:hypothetical protein